MRRPLSPTIWIAPLVGLGLFVASLFYPSIDPKKISVTGLNHVSQTELLAEMNLQKPNPWLWYGILQNAARHLDNPWIQRTRITKIFPNRLRIEITERTPRARLKTPEGEAVIDENGVVLPNAKPTGPLISGWGKDRTEEALEAIQALETLKLKIDKVTYSPSGLRISTTQGSLWCESLDSLYKYASIVTQLKDNRPNLRTSERKINVYPWGVSVTQ
ncbi:MAG: FtsQ-type POTRA domain-containing protein [Deinococcaceae bacterium]